MTPQQDFQRPFREGQKHTLLTVPREVRDNIVSEYEREELLVWDYSEKVVFGQGLGKTHLRSL
jgi:hypothetical protein